MKLRSIPPRTYLSLARQSKLSTTKNLPLRYARGQASNEVKGRQPKSSTELPFTRGRLRPQISRQPLEEKLTKIGDELNELAQFALEGFDISKLKTELENQQQALLKFLGKYDYF